MGPSPQATAPLSSARFVVGMGCLRPTPPLPLPSGEGELQRAPFGRFAARPPPSPWGRSPDSRPAGGKSAHQLSCARVRSGAVRASFRSALARSTQPPNTPLTRRSTPPPRRFAPRASVQGSRLRRATRSASSSRGSPALRARDTSPRGMPPSARRFLTARAVRTTPALGEAARPFPRPGEGRAGGAWEEPVRTPSGRAPLRRAWPRACACTAPPLAWPLGVPDRARARCRVPDVALSRHRSALDGLRVPPFGGRRSTPLPPCHGGN